MINNLSKNQLSFDYLLQHKLNRPFFSQPTLKVAEKLLNKFLVSTKNGKLQIVEITETEAYIGPSDLACHASHGQTERNKIMWDEAGHIYVYLIYGMYNLMNVITERIGYPAAILFRAAKPVLNINIETNGPGKLCRALDITRQDSGLDITASNELFISDMGLKPENIHRTPRIGINYAGPYWAGKLWRFISV